MHGLGLLLRFLYSFVGWFIRWFVRSFVPLPPWRACPATGVMWCADPASPFSQGFVHVLQMSFALKKNYVFFLPLQRHWGIFTKKWIRSTWSRTSTCRTKSTCRTRSCITIRSTCKSFFCFLLQPVACEHNGVAKPHWGATLVQERAWVQSWSCHLRTESFT